MLGGREFDAALGVVSPDERPFGERWLSITISEISSAWSPTVVWETSMMWSGGLVLGREADLLSSDSMGELALRLVRLGREGEGVRFLSAADSELERKEKGKRAVPRPIGLIDWLDILRPRVFSAGEDIVVVVVTCHVTIVWKHPVTLEISQPGFRCGTPKMTRDVLMADCEHESG